MPPLHQTVLVWSTPHGDIAVRQTGMNPLAETRRKNLRARVSQPAELQRVMGGSPGYWSDLLRVDGQKAFGEKIARRIEVGMGWPDGCLDDPLGMDRSSGQTLLAQAVSHRQSIVSPRTLVWEDMVIEDVHGQFILAIVGDALAPHYLPGQSGIWEAGGEGRPGRPVLLVDADGEFYLRLFEPRSGNSWAGVSQRVGHRELTPERDGVRLVARLKFLDLD